MSTPNKAAAINALLSTLEDELATLQEHQKEQLDAANAEQEDNRQENREEELLHTVDQESEQLDALATSLEKLRALDPASSHHEIEYGALVETDHGLYLVSVATPMIDFEGRHLIGISTDSPFYQRLNGLKAGMSCTLNDIAHTIIAIA